MKKILFMMASAMMLTMGAAYAAGDQITPAEIAAARAAPKTAVAPQLVIPVNKHGQVWNPLTVIAASTLPTVVDSYVLTLVAPAWVSVHYNAQVTNDDVNKALVLGSSARSVGFQIFIDGLVVAAPTWDVVALPNYWQTVSITSYAKALTAGVHTIQVKANVNQLGDWAYVSRRLGETYFQ